MATYKISQLNFINIFKEKKITFFTGNDLIKIFEIKNANTLKHFIRRLSLARIIKRLTKDKYLFLHLPSSPSDFSMANFLKFPSYISLESALSYYSVIDQFPYRITSITLKKTKNITVDNKIFNYSRIKKEYFKDYVKIDDFLIASKEKAIFDYLYYTYKGIKSKNIIQYLQPLFKDKKTFEYLKNNSDKRFSKFFKKYVKL